jgi:spore coat protein CotH
MAIAAPPRAAHDVTRQLQGTDMRHPARDASRAGCLCVAALLLAGGLLTHHLASDDDGSGSPISRPRFEPLFAADQLPVFELSVPQRSYENLVADPFSYQPAHFRYRPQRDPGAAIVLPYVGLRLKGMASFNPIDGKPALKIRFDKYIKSQRFLGLRRLTLNNMDQDPSMVRERLSYYVFRRAGLPAPLCNSARVVLNGSYYGLYANVQTIDRVFIEAHFSPARGNLYDTSREHYPIDLEPKLKPFFELKTNRALNRTADLDALVEAAGRPTKDLVTDVASIVDLDEWLAVGAVQAVIADSDGYFGGTNNYELYHDVGSGRFVLLPWGCDQTFGIRDGQFKHLSYRIDGARGSRNGLLFRRCRESPDCYARYLDHVEKALEVWEDLDLPAQLDGILAQITPSVYEDARRPHSLEDFERSVKDVRAFLSERGRVVRRQLRALRARLGVREPQAEPGAGPQER